MKKCDSDSCLITTPTSSQSLQDDGSWTSVKTEENSQLLFEQVFGGVPVSEHEEEALDSPTFARPKTRTRKSKVAIGQEHEKFLLLAKSATPRLVIMRDLGLTDVAFNRHYVTALASGEITPIPDGTVFKPTNFPKEIRELLGCGGFDLISVEVSDAGLVLKKI